MKRYHQELQRTKRVHQEHLRFVHHWPLRAVSCQCELQAGRFRKQKAQGCRKAHCLLCHYDKIFKIAAPKTQRQADRCKASLQEYWNRVVAQ